jgi:hypothetical protein
MLLHPTSLSPDCAAGGYAYVAADWSGLRIIDTTERCP